MAILRTCRNNPVVIFIIVMAVASIAAVLLGVPVSRVTEVTLYTLYGAGVNLLLGYTGLVPFGASVFFGCASYAAAIATLRLMPSEFAGMALATLFALVLGVVIGLIVLRRGGIYFALLTLAFSQIAFEIAFKWTSVTGGENGIQDVPRPVLANDWAFHIFAVLSVAAALLFLWRLVHAPLGRVFQAVRDNEERTGALGYDVFRYKLTAFVISATLIGYSGALLAFMLRGAYANPLSWQHAADPLLMTVFGGVHHFLGPLWGALTFTLLQDRLSASFENWWLVFAPIIIAFALLSSEGLHGLGQKLFRSRGWTLVRPGIPRRPDVIAPLGEHTVKAAAGRPLLSVRGLSKSFGSIVTANDIELDIYPYRLHSLIGPNGAGKTTLFNMLTGNLRADAGRIEFAGQDVTGLPMHKRIRLGIARSFQIISLFRHLTAFETVRLAVQASSPLRFGIWRDAHSYDQINARTWSLLGAVGLLDRADQLCSDLSHGEQRLLDIAMTLATEAKLLLLDEPLAGLAEADRRVVASLVRRLAETHAVVLIEHDIDRVLELSDEITVLHQGRLIVSGSPEEVSRHPEVMEAYLGTAGQRAVLVPSVRRPADRKLLLKLEDIHAGYEGSAILSGLSLEVREGEVVALLGRNGVGKTTTLRAMTGTVLLDSGTITLGAQNITGLKPHLINRAGIAIVPEGRRLFPHLTVWENLRIAQREGGAAIEEIYDLFPKLCLLRDARAQGLSGGERQMVAIARALMAPSRIILLDEPFEGLAPTVVAEVMNAVARLRERASVVIVEHKADMVLGLADRAYILVNGKTAFEGPAQVLAADPALQGRLLGVKHEVHAPASRVEFGGRASSDKFR